MMIDKRLIGTVPESKKYIAANVALQWCGLIANVAMMISVASLLASLLTAPAATARLLTTAAVAAAAVLIRCLCTRHRRALNIVRRAHADSKHIVKHFCMPHGFRSRFVRIHIIPEHLAHSGNLCSAPAQICCCLKSTDTCFGYKIIGINQNSRINSICLLCGKFDIFIKIL